MLMWRHLQFGSLVIFSWIKQIFNFRKAGVLFRQQEQRLQTEQRCGGAARFQYETSLRDEHGALAATRVERNELRVSVFLRKNEQTYFLFHYTTSAVRMALPTHKHSLCYIFVTALTGTETLILATQNHIRKTDATLATASCQKATRWRNCHHNADLTHT